MQRLKKTIYFLLHQWKWSFAITTLGILFWLLLWPSMLVQKSDGMFAGHPFVWADWSWHLAQTTWIAEHPIKEWRSCFPIYACETLNYPFLANAISGVLVKLGTSLTSAMTTSSFFESAISIIFLAILFAHITKKDHVTALSILLFVCSGGLGIWQTIIQKGLQGATQPIESTLFTQIPESGIEFTNIIVGMLVPQRAFLLGLVFALPALFILWKIASQKSFSALYFPIFYLCMAILPIAHTHSFVIVGWTTIWIAIGHFLSQATWDMRARSARTWLLLGIPTLIISAFMYVFFLRPSHPTEPFTSIHIGWLAKEGLLNIVLFWFKNWGVFLVLSAVGTLMLEKKNTTLRHWTWAWWSLFILANLIQFQPQLWDNSKFFAWVYLGLSPIAGQAIFKLRKIKHIGKILAVLALLLSCGSGFADLTSFFKKSSTPVQMFSPAQLELAENVQRMTSKNAIFLTSEYPSNPISSLSGRAIILGYSGWIYSYGMPYAERQRDVLAMFQGDENTTSLLQKYKIDFVLIGENEYSLEPNSRYFSERYPILFSNSAGQIFDVRSFNRKN